MLIQDLIKLIGSQMHYYLLLNLFTPNFFGLL